MGKHIFLIFALKHRLWVLIRNASTCTHNIYILSNNMKIVKKNSTENCHFYSREKSLYCMGLFSLSNIYWIFKFNFGDLI